MKYWFVNLRKYYKEQRKGNFLWAPLFSQSGNKVQHWENMKYVNKGDIIFCNNNKKIVSVARARGTSQLSKIPNEFEQSWKSEGRRIDLDFIDLSEPFRFSDYKENYLNIIDKKENPFDVNGNAKQAYLLPLDEKIAKFFIEKINDNKLNLMIENLDNQFQKEIEELQEEYNQFEKINNGSVSGYSDAELKAIEENDYIYEPKYKSDKESIRREKTDPKLKATRIAKAGYLCEVNHEHITFSNSEGKHQYMESHHIVPMNAQKDFKNIKLDSMFNLISLCPICHSQIHYANNKDKGIIFSKMYEIRKEEMLKHGFDLAKINEIFNKYYKGNN